MSRQLGDWSWRLKGMLDLRYERVLSLSTVCQGARVRARRRARGGSAAPF